MSEPVGGGAAIETEFDSASGMWWRWGKPIWSLSFVGLWESETDGGPTPMAGNTREWTRAADHVDRYTPTRKATTVDLTVFRMEIIGYIRTHLDKYNMDRPA